MRAIPRLLCLLIVLSAAQAFGETITSTSPAPRQKDISVSISTGVRMLPNFLFGFIPMPPTAALTVDSHHMRFRADLSYHPFIESVHAVLGAGAVFVPVGKNASANGGFQLKLPILIDTGIVTVKPYAGDGYYDDILWLLIGPSAGTDLTWWKAGKIGFTISLKVGYQFRIDLDSYYEDGYSSAEDTIGLADIAVMFGVTI